jgi:hypothetical protein
MSASSEASVKPIAKWQRSPAMILNVVGLVVTAAGLLLQIAAGSGLYPSLAGPIVLVVTAVIVAFGPWRWTAYIALLVPLVLGVGAIVAAAMTGEFTSQLVAFGNPGIVLGSLMHSAGLIGAVVGAIGMLRRPRHPLGDAAA